MPKVNNCFLGTIVCLLISFMSCSQKTDNPSNSSSSEASKEDLIAEVNSNGGNKGDTVREFEKLNPLLHQFFKVVADSSLQWSEKKLTSREKAIAFFELSEEEFSNWVEVNRKIYQHLQSSDLSREELSNYIANFYLNDLSPSDVDLLKEPSRVSCTNEHNSNVAAAVSIFVDCALGNAEDEIGRCGISLGQSLGRSEKEWCQCMEENYLSFKGC